MPLEDALCVRRAVFIEELGFPPEIETDALDEISWQAVLYKDGAPVASGRIYWEGGDFFLGRICVLRAWRNRGMGDALMRLLIKKALNHAAGSLVLCAIRQAVPFFERYGFRPVGEPCDVDGMPHRHMRATAEALRAPRDSGDTMCPEVKTIRP